MIEHTFYIDDWTIHGYYSVNRLDLNTILKHLKEINCNYLNEASNLILKRKYNYGITYSNLYLKTSILIIGECKSDLQLINTMCHEARHLQQHIALDKHLNENQEQVCYIIGEICEKIYFQLKQNKLL